MTRFPEYLKQALQSAETEDEVEELKYLRKLYLLRLRYEAEKKSSQDVTEVTQSRETNS